jgi:hypothetical protein
MDMVPTDESGMRQGTLVPRLDTPALLQTYDTWSLSSYSGAVEGGHGRSL